MSPLWHYHNEPIFLFLVCATDLHFKNYNRNLYHGEVLQYTILKFLQYPQVFSFIDINVLILLQLLQKSNKTLTVVLKEGSNLHVFGSLVPHVTCRYSELLFLKTTKTKKWWNVLSAYRNFFLVCFIFNAVKQCNLFLSGDEKILDQH